MTSQETGLPVFAPLLSSRPVVSGEGAIRAACEAAAKGKAEAGDLFWSSRTADLDLAIVLEPEVPVQRAREMLFTLMVAAADSIGALSPPELALTWCWPNVLKANGARIGRAQLQLGPVQDEARGDVPDWMVVGLDIALAARAGEEPGSTPDTTSLWDEGATQLDRIHLLESLSRHFLTWVHRWEEDGFRPVHEAWLFRCEGYRSEVKIGTQTGTFSGLDETGNLLLNDGGTGMSRITLAAALEQELIATSLKQATQGTASR